ncbi:hypothetical protein [Metabacillus dongyingensis]|uniref:hypothetical protein n=1 Tax=Metabacillus dongyingensis TaxID=2874282 RepID=UPI001CBD75D0|nr:hypothetical protein [Metabacillus dongyingensis]UAL50804.1 hypothetical protein K8L98_16410 [Metabacillus dongyingensis]
MAYLIEDANILKNGEIVKTSILIRNNKIDYMSSSLQKMTCMKMNAADYLLTSGHVMLDFSIGGSFSEIKRIFTEKLIAKGCTTVIAIAETEYERDLPEAIRKKKQMMINSPIDYCIGVKVPLKRLTPSLLISCKKNKIPLLILEIHPEDSIADFPWEWIRGSIYGFPMTFLPQLTGIHSDKRRKQFSALMNRHRMSAEPDCPSEHVPLEKSLLMKIGIYPEKGDIRIGGEVDYNLYVRNGFNSVEEMSASRYHNHIPTFTIHKGQLIKVDEKVCIRPGFGEFCEISMSGRFAANAVP